MPPQSAPSLGADALPEDPLFPGYPRDDGTSIEWVFRDRATGEVVAKKISPRQAARIGLDLINMAARRMPGGDLASDKQGETSL